MAKDQEEAAKRTKGALVANEIAPNQTGKIDGQEDLIGGLEGCQEKPIDSSSTSPTYPDTSKKDIDGVDHSTNDHPHEVTGGQNTSDDRVSAQLHSITENQEDPMEDDYFIYDHPQHTTYVVPIQTVIPNLETPIVVQKSTLVACEPPDPVFALIQAFGATTSQMLDTQ
ncbi:hypothetical protein HAX54_044144, partial [Datura stramonium]|nr:hypothetical protein [Datura stramonium]